MHDAVFAGISIAVAASNAVKSTINNPSGGGNSAPSTSPPSSTTSPPTSSTSTQPPAVTSTPATTAPPTKIPETTASARAGYLGNYVDYLNALAQKESSDNYTVENSYGYLGRYQLGNLALQDAGFKDGSGNWTQTAIDLGVNSKDDFLNSPAAQEAAIRAYHKAQLRYINNYGLYEYIGSEFFGVEVTESGLLSAAHLVGAQQLRNGFRDGFNPSDANGTTASSYMKKFGWYDLSDLQ